MAMGGDHTGVAFVRNSRVNTVVSSDANQTKNSMAAQKIPGAACACWLVHWKCTATVNAIKAQLHLTDATFINRKYYLDLCQFCLFFLHLILLTISERVIMLYVLNRGAS